MSFTASTRVLTAGGGLVAISKLRRGDKVKATNTRTGRTSAQTVAAVLVHHDTNLYDLRVKTGHGSAVIDTTRTHLFWDQDTSRWIKAAALKYGSHLRPPAGGTVTVTGGYTPRDTTGWMWDLTITTDHDFYIQTAGSAILAHNCPTAGGSSAEEAGDVSPTVGELRSAGLSDAHHIIQDAAVRDVEGYATNDAPGVQLEGPSTEAGTPHYLATQVQRTAGIGGTYGVERQVAEMALTAAGLGPDEVAGALERADEYFMEQLGLTEDSPLRIPGNRVTP
jgi:hypothetical protein